MIIGIDGNEANVKKRVGSGMYALELLREFAKDKKHRFIIFLKEKPLPDLPAESQTIAYKIFGPKKFWTQFALPAHLAFGQKIDVFFSMAHYGPRFSKVPYVVTIHDLSYLHYPKLFKKNDLYQLVNWSKYSIAKSTHIIAVSHSTKEDIVKNYKIDPAKIAVTYEGYDESFKPASESEIKKAKEKYKIVGDYIIFVGTLQPRKNLERLIEAFHQLINKIGVQPLLGVEPLKLVICGKRGWLYEPIFEKVKELQLEKSVIFTDYIPNHDLPALISGAKLYVLPSLWEGFGIPVIEAQACGTPTVVSNTSSLPEIVTLKPVIPAKAGIPNKILDRVENDNRVSALLVDPVSVESIANGISNVLTDEKLAQNLVEKGYQNIKRFSWQKCAEETLTVLTKSAELKSGS